MELTRLGFKEFAAAMHGEGDDKSQTLLVGMASQLRRTRCAGWFLAVATAGERKGEKIVLPFGGTSNTYARPPETPFSPRGILGDGYEVMCYTLAEDLPRDGVAASCFNS